MITYKELLSNHPISEVEIAIQHCLEDLLFKMNQVRAKYNKPMIITSGLRTKEDQNRVYSKINAERTKVGKTPLSIPYGSSHIKGKACDVLDTDGTLMQWCRDNEAFLVEVGLWIEDDTEQPRVHFQANPYKSWTLGKSQFFKP